MEVYCFLLSTADRGAPELRAVWAEVRDFLVCLSSRACEVAVAFDLPFEKEKKASRRSVQS